MQWECYSVNCHTVRRFLTANEPGRHSGIGGGAPAIYFLLFFLNIGSFFTWKILLGLLTEKSKKNHGNSLQVHR